MTATKDGVRSGAGVFVLPPGTHRLSGRLVWEGRPAAGFVLDVVAGTGTGLAASTDSSGWYALYGLAGIVQITISTDGTPYLTCTASVTDHTVMDIEVPVSGPVTSGCRRGL